jgi:hypothetical protein
MALARCRQASAVEAIAIARSPLKRILGPGAANVDGGPDENSISEGWNGATRELTGKCLLLTRIYIERNDDPKIYRPENPKFIRRSFRQAGKTSAASGAGPTNEP